MASKSLTQEIPIAIINKKYLFVTFASLEHPIWFETLPFYAERFLFNCIYCTAKRHLPLPFYLKFKSVPSLDSIYQFSLWKHLEV